MSCVRFAALAFILHLAWEMVQMPLYEGMDDRPWSSTAATCTRAALFDVAVTLAVGLPFVLIARRRPSSVRPWLGMTAAGAVAAIAIEQAGLSGGHWAYAGDMPMLPLLHVGVVPILQMMLIPCLSAWLTLRPRRAVP